MNLLPINVAIGANRALAQSALPDAPVVPETPRRRPVRTTLRTVLTAVARRHTTPDQARPSARHTAGNPAQTC